MGIAVGSSSKGPGFFDMLLHSQPNKLDTGMHGIGLALNAGFTGWAIYKLATDKKMSTGDQIGYFIGMALSVPFSALDLYRLIHAHRFNHGHQATIQRVARIQEHLNASAFGMHV